MDADKPVTAIMSFDLLPRHKDAWQREWNTIWQHALAEGGCRQFRLLRNRHDETEHLVISGWERASDLAAFVRDKGLLWRCDAVEDTRCPPTFSVLESIPVTPEIGATQRARQLVPDRATTSAGDADRSRS